ncbi:MAG: hypothetical protein RIT81_18765 [Deltaproteobacteria bacterium]
MAQEAGITDPALDGIAEDLADSELAPDRRAQLALTMARAGRAEDRAVLAPLSGEGAHAMAYELARSLLAPNPSNVERADSGYRFVSGEDVLYVEDPVAAHFHAKGRWGPPLRADPRGPWRLARGEVSSLIDAASEGECVVVTLRHDGARTPALRVLRAGITRDASLRSIVRWPAITGLGRMGEGVAFEQGGAPHALGVADEFSSEQLLALLGGVRARALPSAH